MFWIVVEIAVLLIAVGVFVLYRKTIRPLNIIGNGMDLLKEQDFSSRLKHVGQRDADKVVDIFNKMMDQLKNERLQLREQNQFLDLLIASSPLGVVILGFDEQILQINPAGQKIFEELSDRHSFRPSLETNRMIGQHLGEFPPLGVKLAALERGESRIIRMSNASVYKCTCSTFMENGFYHKFYMVEQMTQEVLITEKKAYEKVIRTIAHEVNNSIAGIRSTLDVVTESWGALDSGERNPDESKIQLQAVGLEEASEENIAFIRMLSIASDRCSSLSRFITQYANVVKIPDPQCSEVFLNDFIRSVSRFFEMLCVGKPIEIQYHLVQTNPSVRMDTVLMEQALVNMAKNSIEAIGAGTGVIVVSTFENGSLEIADNGTGISPEMADKLFTPFFSTKPNGQGIGLIFIREVLQKHGFHFSLQTYPDGFTRFRIDLE